MIKLASIFRWHPRLHWIGILTSRMPSIVTEPCRPPARHKEQDQDRRKYLESGDHIKTCPRRWGGSPGPQSAPGRLGGEEGVPRGQACPPYQPEHVRVQPRHHEQEVDH